VATHAVGDAAIDLVLDAYEQADAERSIKDRRWAIEHGFIPRPDQFPRMRKLGLVVTAQNHLYVAGPSLVKYWGAGRGSMVTPVRTYLEEGIPVSSGTDAPVNPFNPFWTLYHFITRGTVSAGVLGAEQRIGRIEALRMSTAGNAYLTFEETVKGTIEPGRLADLTVLSHDILTCDESWIEKMDARMTLVNGRVVYDGRQKPKD
jgi:predicted amidohydrolase YtcJ